MNSRNVNHGFIGQLWLKHKSQSRRKGAIVVLAAVMMVALMGMAAFSVDLGLIALAKMQLQDAADAAALAGGSQLRSRELLKAKTLSSADLNSARFEAIKLAQMHKCAGKPITLTASGVEIGYISNPDDPTSALQTQAGRYNSVRVTVKRTAAENGSLSLFFAGVLDRKTIDVQAIATASYRTNVRGFKTTETAPRAKLLPITLHVDIWRDVLAGSGTDLWAYDVPTKTVSSGSDGARELTAYSKSKTTKGHFGTIDIGNTNGSTKDLVRQILEGPNQSDFDLMGGSFSLGADGTTTVPGDAGLSLGIKSALTSIVGQPRIVPLYDQVSGFGEKAQYRIVGFAGIIITRVEMNGLQKRLLVQPEFCDDPTAIYGGTPAAETFIYSLGLTR